MNKNFSDLLNEIKANTHWSETRIASELGISQPTVNRILKGQVDCKGSTLSAIVDLHKKVCVEAVEKINGSPRRRRTDKRIP